MRKATASAASGAPGPGRWTAGYSVRRIMKQVHNVVAEGAALVIAHPGHELAILGWLGLVRPTVFVLTDGSGRDGVSRIASTTAILDALGAEPGPMYGSVVEHEVYDALLSGDTELFVGLAETLAEQLIAGDHRLVVGEAAEGFQPTHDVFRLVVDAATELARRGLGRPLPRYDFVLFARQASYPSEARDAAVWIELEDGELDNKLRLAAEYRELAAEYHAAVSGDLSAVLGQFPELAAGAAATIGELGPEAYRIECLRPSPPGVRPECLGAGPFYEIYGEALRAAGKITEVIRLEQHLRPVAEALARRIGPS